MRLFLKSAVVAAALCSALIFATSAQALVVPMDADDLVRAADSVVVAKVTGKQVKADVDPRSGRTRDIDTQTTLRVVHTLKGAPSSEKTAVQPGGEVGDTGLFVPDVATFVRGEECVVFLDASGGVIGGYQGKLAVEDGRIPALGMSIEEFGQYVSALEAGAVSGPVLGPPSDLAEANVQPAALVTPDAIISVSPSNQIAGMAQTVTISGSGFGATQGTVGFENGLSGNGNPYITATVVSWSDAAIVVQVPANACTGPVRVTTSGGTVYNSAVYDVGFSTDGVKWSTFPVSFVINENCPDTTGEGAQVQAALATWSAAGSNFEAVYAGTSNRTAYDLAANSVNEIFWSTDMPSDTGWLAQCKYWYSPSTKTTRESDIVFNDWDTWKTTNSGGFDIQTVALHELGHSVGLDDQYPDVERAMGAYNGSLRRSLSQDEIDGALYLYGAAPSVPSVTSVTHPSESTWSTVATATFSWNATATGGVNGYSWTIDGSALTVPDTTSEGVATATTQVLSDGQWYLHVRARSADGAWGRTRHYGVRVDRTAPAGTVQIGPSGGGVAYVNSLSVSIDATLTDPHSGLSQMRTSDGATWSSWAGHVAHSTVTLAGADGTRTLEAQYRDAAGNVRSAARDVVLDRVRPSSTATAFVPPSGAANVTLNASDDRSGVARVLYGVDVAPWATYTTPVVVSTPGTHTVQFAAVDRAGNVELTKSLVIKVSGGLGPATLARISGSDRYAVAAAVGKAAHPGWAGVTDVIIASGEDRAAADPLAASGLAGALDAPILLVRNVLVNGALPPETEKALGEIRAANGGSVHVHVVGGIFSVPGTVYARLDTLNGPDGTIERIAGADRYSTSAVLAERVVSIVGIDAVPGVLIAAGDTTNAFYDALAASPVSYGETRPMLLTQAGALPNSVKFELQSTFAGKEVLAVNGPGYLSDAVMLSAGASARMAASGNRIVAATQIADYSSARGWGAGGAAAVTNRLPDALTGGAALGTLGGPVLYTDASTLAAPTSAWLASHKSGLAAVYVIGGDVSVKPAAFQQVDVALH